MTPEVRDIQKIFWKRGEIAHDEQFLLLSTIFCYLLVDFHVKTGTKVSPRDKRLFEINEVEITRVDCIFILWHYFLCVHFSDVVRIPLPVPDLDRKQQPVRYQRQQHPQCPDYPGLSDIGKSVLISLLLICESSLTSFFYSSIEIICSNFKTTLKEIISQFD